MYMYIYIYIYIYMYMYIYIYNVPHKWFFPENGGGTGLPNSCKHADIPDWIFGVSDVQQKKYHI